MVTDMNSVSFHTEAWQQYSLDFDLVYVKACNIIGLAWRTGTIEGHLRFSRLEKDRLVLSGLLASTMRAGRLQTASSR